MQLACASTTSGKILEQAKKSENTGVFFLDIRRWLSFPSRYRFTAYVLSSTDTFLLDIKYAESKGFFDFKAERELYSIVKAW